MIRELMSTRLKWIAPMSKYEQAIIKIRLQPYFATLKELHAKSSDICNRLRKQIVEEP
jgi:hypothetical protein